MVNLFFSHCLKKESTHISLQKQALFMQKKKMSDDILLVSVYKAQRSIVGQYFQL